MCAVILCHLSDLINTGHSGIFMACQKNNRLRHFILIILNNYKRGINDGRRIRRTEKARTLIASALIVRKL